jgi:glyoxylase-like metal-dependent hydrolase (beta-lactamase superfamily II)
LIVPLHAGNPSAMTGSGNWTYFLPGHYPLLIDAGVGDAAHLEAIAEARREGPGRVVVTHAHVDHISGAPALGRQWPGTSFSKLLWPDRDAKYDIAWMPLGDGDVIPAGDEELQVVHTPGHAPDHIALWHAASRTLISGDLVVRGTTVVIPATGGGSLTAYIRSLERVLELDPARLLPAHGAPIDNPEGLIRQYIAHRHEREVQVRSGVARGLRTVDRLVEHIYKGLSPAIVPMARETVLAHLVKLEDEGTVGRDGDQWLIRPQGPGPRPR